MIRYNINIVQLQKFNKVPLKTLHKKIYNKVISNYIDTEFKMKRIQHIIHSDKDIEQPKHQDPYNVNLCYIR